MKICVTGIRYWENEINWDSKLPYKIESLPLNNAQTETIFNQYKVRFRQGQINLDHPFYPKPSDLKVMRDDTVASVICAQLLMDYADFPDIVKDEMSLMVANSNFIDNGILDFNSIAQAISEVQKANTAEEKNRSLGAEVSPLIPLRTLTNGAESFVAQYTQIKGESTTYGSTCISTGHALDDAMSLFKLGLAQTAMVGGSHFANVFSFLNHYLLLSDCEEYAESTSASFFLIETASHANLKGHEVLLWIENLLFNQWPVITEKVSRVYCGGSFTKGDSDSLLLRCQKQFSLEAITLFPFLGSLGCSELGFLLALADIQLGQGESALIYMEDVFGKFLCLTVKKP